MSRNKERIEKALRERLGMASPIAHWTPVTGQCFEKGGYEGGWTLRDEQGMDYDFLGYSTAEALEMVEVKAKLHGKQ